MIGRLKSLLKPNKTYDEDINDAYLIVPDLHGVYTVYQEVERYIKKSHPDRHIIFLGDYMDRGESGEVYGIFFKDSGSMRIMKALIELKKWAEDEGRELSFLRGNHETFFEDYYLHDDDFAYGKYEFFKNSVDCLNHVFEKEPVFYEAFILFLKELKAYHHDRVHDYLFIHAGIDPDMKGLEAQAEDGLIYWIRDVFIFSEKKLPYTVVFGHTPFSRPFIREDKIGLDSGVYKRGFINLLEVNDGDHTIITLGKKAKK
jgi:serine/threonine protein phosphatase 1